MSLLKYPVSPKLFELLGSVSEVPKHDCVFTIKPQLRCHHNLYLYLCVSMCVFVFPTKLQSLGGHGLWLSSLHASGNVSSLPPEWKWYKMVHQALICLWILVIYSYLPLVFLEAPVYICLWEMSELTSNHDDPIHLSYSSENIIKWLLVSTSVTSWLWLVTVKSLGTNHLYGARSGKLVDFLP